jgi:hypothetical protein
MAASEVTASRRGREATAEELALRLQSAPPDYLEGALDNPALSEEHVLEILRNPGAPAHVLQRLGFDTRWTSSYAAKVGLVCHPACPASVSLHLVNFLYWRDLARVSDNFRLPAPLRRSAENLLKERLPELSLGERMALARIAGRALIAALRNEPNEMVIGALLGNPRLTEEDLLLLCNTSTSAKVLTLVGQSERWRARPPVRLALARNRHTPLALSVSLLPGLSDADLRDLSQHQVLPQALRGAASRLLLERRRVTALETRRA